MRVVVMAAVAAGLAACSPGGASGNEEELAAKIVDADGVLDLGDETVSSVVSAQLQGVVMQTPNVTPDQSKQLETAIRKNIEAEMPALKKEIAGFLGETFDAKELEAFYAYVSSKEGEAIKQRLPLVMQKSLEAADTLTTRAVDKAIADVIGAPPSTPAPPADSAPPSPAPANPTKPQ